MIQTARSDVDHYAIGLRRGIRHVAEFKSARGSVGDELKRIHGGNLKRPRRDDKSFVSAANKDSHFPMQVFCCQYDIAWEDKASNYDRVKSLLESANLPKNALVALPEMSFTGFSMDVDRIAEPENGDSERFLSGTAREFGVFLAGGVVTRGFDGRGRNQLVVFTPEGKQAGRYTKMRPFTLGGEANHYTEGGDVTTFHCGEWLVSSFICYDLRFPELFRAAAALHPHLFVVIANWPVTRIAHWLRLLQARAIENQAYVMGVNRCGSDPRYAYSGRSVIVNPHGDIISDAGEKDGIINAELDLKWLSEYRRELPFLEDMREIGKPVGAHSRT